MPHALVAVPAPWNILVRVATLPDAHPQTIFASGHHHTLGGTSAGKALGLARLGVDAATRFRAALTRPSGAAAVGEVVDTNGAGDAFAAGLLLGHLEAPP
jgi:acarbose 7IV-phosphotransferase